MYIFDIYLYKYKTSVFSDRGYTSDGELYESQSKAYRCPSPLEVRPVPENGSWVLVSTF
jgi:hypothetical protein